MESLVSDASASARALVDKKVGLTLENCGVFILFVQVFETLTEVTADSSLVISGDGAGSFTSDNVSSA